MSGVNTSTAVLDSGSGRILCIADVRGHLSTLNQLARDARAVAIIHTGDFGFFEPSSVDRISDRTLRHLVSYSPLIPQDDRPNLLAPDAPLRNLITSNSTFSLSEFPQLLSGQITFDVPVYTVWGACEDVSILENFRTGTYTINNLHILDEATTRRIDVGGVSLRLLGLGGALVPHKLFDNGDGRATIAGGQGTMWTTVLQMGELLDTARRVYDASETRLLVTHASPGREGILAQLALATRADLTVSAGLHFRHASSYNEFSVQEDMDGFRNKLVKGKETFDRVWENVRAQVEAVVDDRQRILLESTLGMIERIPPPVPPAGPNPTGPIPGEEPAWKNCWNWNLCDASYGSLILEVKEGRISAELKSQGFNYGYRKNAAQSAQSQNVNANASANPSGTKPPTAAASPAPGPASKLKSAPGTKPGTPAPAPGTKPTTPAPGGTKSTTPAVSKPGTPVNGKRGKRGSVDESALSPGGDESGLPDESNSRPFDSNLDSVKSQDGRSTGAQTPPTGPRRHPWTLYIRPLPIPVTEDEIRTFFGDSASLITNIKIPLDHKSIAPLQRGFAYVEFADEEGMKVGMEKHGETIQTTRPHVEVSNPTEHSSTRGSFRGRGGGGPGRGASAQNKDGSRFGGLNRMGQQAFAAAAGKGPGKQGANSVPK
ncbi:putative ser/thr protein phosphatase [Rhizoctonia solani 123E]|uniref:Putative ser/thr protein phosphatase n=1 Tax=Rhizoctonia solani 123E TaxID=1423351 RepID=A0A074SH91_9AGAM|nr:putative ser/thr protein phosphatase [Rhizoctonia solani 123E]